jgi:hypothetical protein
MSNPFTSADIANMVEAQEIHAYVDTAVYIHAPDPNVTDSYGQVTQPTTEYSGECAFVDQAKRENWREADIEQLDAEIFLTFITPTKGGTFRITHRFGEAVTNVTFEVVGVQNRGAFGYVCALKAVSL